MTFSAILETVEKHSSEYHSQLSSFSTVDKYVVVIGFGSIGKRIYRLLKSLDIKVRIVSRHEVSSSTSSKSLDISHMSADMIVIATETSDHLRQLALLYQFNYQGMIYVEKPLISSSQETDIIYARFDRNFINRIFCGYNFRYHLLTDLVRCLIYSYPSESFVKYVYNENVKTWNYSIPWRESYATSLSGGGAVMTLSHAVDQLRYLGSDSLSFENVFIMPSLLNTKANEGIVAQFCDSNTNSPLSGLLEIGYHSYPGLHVLSLNSSLFSLVADFKAEKLQLSNPDTREVFTICYDNLRDLSIKKSLLSLLCTNTHLCNFTQSILTLDVCETLLSL